MNDQIQSLIDQIPGSSRSSEFMDRLKPESREVLDVFKTWLVTDDGKADSTANAYKGYVAKALCHIEDGGQVSELDTDVKSALNALKRFQVSGVLDQVEPGE